MAKKKVTEEVAPEVVEEVKEEVKEVKPKTTRKTSTKKKTEKVEEAPVEEIPAAVELVEEPVADAVEVKAEEPVVEEPVVEEVKEEPVVEKVEVKEEPAPVVVPKPEVKTAASEFPYLARVTAKNILPIHSAPNVFARKIGTLAPDSKIKILDVSGNWGFIGKDRWVNINFIEKV